MQDEKIRRGILSRKEETIAQVIMFHTAVSLYLAITAVMVGQKQTFRGNKLSRASTAKQYYCVFERCLVDVIYIFCA